MARRDDVLTLCARSDCPAAAEAAWSLLDDAKRRKLAVEPFDVSSATVLAGLLAIAGRTQAVDLVRATTDPAVLDRGVSRLSAPVASALLDKPHLAPATVERIADATLPWVLKLRAAHHPSCSRATAERLYELAQQQLPSVHPVIPALRCAQRTGAELVALVRSGAVTPERALIATVDHRSPGLRELLVSLAPSRADLDAALISRALLSLRPIDAELIASFGLDALSDATVVSDTPLSFDELTPLVELVRSVEDADSLAVLLSQARGDGAEQLALLLARLLASRGLWAARKAWQMCMALADERRDVVVELAAGHIEAFAAALVGPVRLAGSPCAARLMMWLEAADGRDSPLVERAAVLAARSAAPDAFVAWLRHTTLPVPVVRSAIFAHAGDVGAPRLLDPALLARFGTTDIQRRLLRAMFDVEELSDEQFEHVRDLPGLLVEFPHLAVPAAMRAAASLLNGGQLVVLLSLASRHVGTFSELVAVAQRT